MIESKGALDFEDFVRLKFIQDNVEVFVSYPNFDRTAPDTREEGKDRYYYNVAIRFPQGSANDLVLMGDILERDRNGHRQFKVKAILSMDRGIVHYGEIKLKCNSLVRLSDGWESSEGVDRFPTNDQVINSALSDDFMLKLNKMYVVSKPSEVENYLRLWKMYLASRNYILDKEAAEGYDLEGCIPQVFKAYSSEGVYDLQDHNPVPYITPVENQAWTMDRIDDSSREALLLHLYIDYRKSEYDAKRRTREDLKKALDSFTRNPNLLADPEMDRIGEKQDSAIIRIRDGRIQVSFPEEIQPLEKLKKIREEYETQKLSARQQSDRNFKKVVKQKVSEFKDGPLLEMVSEFIKSQEEAVKNRVIADCDRRREIAMADIDEKRFKSNKKIEDAENKTAEIRSRIAKIEQGLSERDIILSEKADVEFRISKLERTSEGTSDEKEAVLNDLRNHLNSINSKLSEFESLPDEYEKLRKKLSDADNSLKLSLAEVRKINEEAEKVIENTDPDRAFEREIKTLADYFSKQKVSDYEDEIKTELEPENNRELTERINTIEAECRSKEDEARKDLTIMRLHLTYEIDVPDTDTVDNRLVEYASKMRAGLSLRKDFTGERIIIRRQEESLDNLIHGYVMNPFLVTALFNPGSNGDHSHGKLERFFLKDLNEGQREAVTRAVTSNGMFLIQGPPGTGKTQVIAEISAQLASSGRKVLIASENNKAVDNAFSRLPKIPSIRPIRILSEAQRNKGKRKSKKGKKDDDLVNPFAVEKLLENFYRSISDSLEREVRKYKDRKMYLEELEADLDNIRGIRDRIESLEDQASDVSLKISELRSKVDREQAKKNSIEVENNVAIDLISDLEDRLRRLKEFSDESEVEPVIKILSEEGFNADAYGNPAEVVQLLAVADRQELISEYRDAEKKHHKYFDLLAMKRETEDRSEISKINMEIHKYLVDTGLEPTTEFKTLSKLYKIPDKNEIIAAKDVIDDHMEEIRSDIENEIADRRNSIRDTSRITRKIAELNEQIRNLESEDTYTQLEKAKSEFAFHVREAFVKLNTRPSSNSPDDIIEDLSDEISRSEMELSGDVAETEEKVDAYNRISRYIRSDDVISADSLILNPELLNHVNVFGMTCTSDNRITDDSDKKIPLNKLNIDVVIIDEVSKVTFLDLLRPILYGKTVILVGDHKQLAPMYDMIDRDEMSRYDPEYINEQDEDNYRRMFETSFFEKLYLKTPDSNKFMLSTQYRMHPDIMGVDNVFYNGQLTFGGQEAFKEHFLTITGAKGATVIGKDDHVVFIDCKGMESKESGSTSYTNKNEAEVVRRLLDSIDNNCKFDRNNKRLGGEIDRRHDDRLSVGVICAYADQARLIRGKRSKRYQTFNEASDERFMVKTVDDFQGDERDIIILSMVRTRRTPFLANYHRINVAVSRARRLLIIVGNRSALESIMVDIDGKRQPVYGNMIRAIERKGRLLTMEDITGGE